jgi:cell division protein FtsW
MRKNADTIILAVFGLLLLVGFVTLASASAVLAFQRYGDANALLKRQIFSAVLGLIAFAFTVRFPYTRWRRLGFPLLCVGIVMLGLVLIPGIGASILGARRWIAIGSFYFQPVEVVKLCFLLYLAVWLERRGRNVADFSSGFVAFISLLGLITLLVALQPDIGSISVVGVIALVMYFVAGAPLPYFALIGVGSAILFAFIVKIAPYRAARLTVFLHPELDPQGIGYHVNQALLAIGSGGLFGLGLGHSRQKFNFLPEAAGDSIIAIIAEELGFLFVVLLIGLFVVFFLRGISVARRAPDAFGRYVATGITAWITLQAFINMAALARLLPLTGIPLPFVSYGGTALVVSMAAVGILVNISRSARPERGGSHA